ncbi:MAG: VacJ family lipoprotein [Pseudomonadota bacterium]|nr:VacJ family lipoprotein [Pseudomonadota bacterium]MDP1903276.1 VacJ family lipoprotein [Pseudomonadota bacterium]MDP2353400.1 VacJ family lipoprotein [Pseudomonadota bacterium]
MKPLSTLLLSLLLAPHLAGCASNGDPRDPLEPMNRAIHDFNEGLDRAVMKSVATGYQKVMPGFAQTGVRNFFSNLNDVTVLANNMLQLKLENSVSDVLRISFNSTFGFLGVLDIASEMGLDKQNEDFGQTLGHWGVGNGAYLVLPFFGPSSFRDGAGLVVDMTYTDLLQQVSDIPRRTQTSVLRVVSRRADLIEAKNAIDAAALDPYEFTRDLYLERRRAQVHDGRPPAEE